MHVIMARGVPLSQKRSRRAHIAGVFLGLVTSASWLLLRSAANERLRVDSGHRQSHHIRDEQLGHQVEGILKLWSTDLHAGPVGCQLSMFESLNVDVTAQIDFSNCKFFVNRRGKDLCADKHSGLRFDRNRGYSLDPNPNVTRLRLFGYYRGDDEFRQADIVMCSHPVANCELYLPFNKSLIIYNTQRVEFGRNDEFIWWRQPHLKEDRHLRWRQWVTNLRALSKSERNVIAANNLYDVKHMEYLTGIKPQYIPSWCGHMPHEMEKDTYEPLRDELVLTPYRTNLEYAKDSIPHQGWPSKRSKAHYDPLEHAIFDGLRAISGNSSRLNLINMRTAFPPKGKFKTMQDFRDFRAVLFIPYVPSVMFFFEIYRTNVPILAPSRKLLGQWVAEHRILWETSYGNPDVLANGSLHALLPNPNKFDASSRKEWMKFYDVYAIDVFPHILYFDSWEHAVQIVEHTDFAAVSKSMRIHNIQEYTRIRGMWDVIISRIRQRKLKNDRPDEVNHFNTKKQSAVMSKQQPRSPSLQHELNAALAHEYGLAPLSIHVSLVRRLFCNVIKICT